MSGRGRGKGQGMMGKLVEKVKALSPTRGRGRGRGRGAGETQPLLAGRGGGRGGGTAGVQQRQPRSTKELEVQLAQERGVPSQVIRIFTTDTSGKRGREFEALKTPGEKEAYIRGATAGVVGNPRAKPEKLHQTGMNEVEIMRKPPPPPSEPLPPLPKKAGGGTKPKNGGGGTKPKNGGAKK